MKTKIFLIAFFLSQIALSQTVVKSSIDNGGASISNANIELLYTIGEVNVQEVTIGNVSISEGFINPILINTSPIIDNIIAPVDPIALGNVATVTAEFTDDNLREGLIDWGDGNGFVAGDIIEQTVVWNHTYTTPGVYEIKVKIVDMADELAEEVYQYIVVYDPSGGFVTGGGWINSPAGAYIDNPLLEGKANFGFVAKYKKGQTVPTGNTEFQFKAGDLKFNSSLFDWLVIAGTKAKFKGVGTINGIGSYGFMISAIDEDSKDKIDKFRIKIWDMANEDIVYDNQNGAEDNSDPTTEIQGGAIVVHSRKKDSDQSKLVADKNTNQLNVYPNPFSETTNIELVTFKSKQASIEVYDLYGRLVERLYDGQINAEDNNLFQLNRGNKLSPGVYIVRVLFDNDEVHTKNVIFVK